MITGLQTLWRYAQVRGWRVMVEENGHTWFEYVGTQDVECSGIIEVEHNNGNSVVVGYDGVFELPKPVAQGLVILGFAFDKFILPEGMEV